MANKPNIAQLKKGDELAWLWFYEEFYAPVYRYISAKGVADSENVAGNVMEAVAKSINPEAAAKIVVKKIMEERNKWPASI